MTLAPSLTDPNKYYAFNNDGTETELNVIRNTKQLIVFDSKVNQKCFEIKKSVYTNETIDNQMSRSIKNLRDNYTKLELKDKEYIFRLLQLIEHKIDW